MLLQRDYQAISAALAGFEPPEAITPIAKNLVSGIMLRRAVGGDMQAFLESLRDCHGDEFITNIWQEMPKPDTGELAIDETNDWEVVPAKNLWRAPSVDWMIPGIIPEHSLMMVYGPSGVGKSFLCLDYALQVAQESTVVYVASEGMNGLRQRVGAWCKHNNKSEDNLLIINGTVHLLNREKLDIFIEKMRRFAPRLIIFDTLARSMVGYDENSARDMGLLVQATDKIREELNCTALLVHHTKKNGTGERGSSALRGACDQIIRLDGDDNLMTWEIEKTKDSDPHPARHLKLQKVAFDSHGLALESCVLVDAEETAITLETLNKTQKRVLATLSLSIFEDGADVPQIAADIQKSSQTVYRALSVLKELELIEGKGKVYRLTDNARKNFSFSNAFDACLTKQRENVRK